MDRFDVTTIGDSIRIVDETVAEGMFKTNFYRLRDPPRVVKEGWLFKKNTRRTIRRWSRRWFVLKEDSIFYYRNGVSGEEWNYLKHSRGEIKRICHIMLCTLRQKNVHHPNKRRYRFEIVTPTGHSYQLRASDESEYRSWVGCIQKSIVEYLMDEKNDLSLNVENDEMKECKSSNGFSFARRRKEKKWRLQKKRLVISPNDEGTHELLESSGSMSEPSEYSSVTCSSDNGGINTSHSFDLSDSSSSCDGSASKFGELDEMSVVKRSLETMDKAMNTVGTKSFAQQIMRNNRFCADCGERDPDWISLNLGVVICITCSGIHRSLGVHKSKVRSLKLDEISPAEGRLLLTLGNSNINAIRESSGSYEVKKSDSSTSSQIISEKPCPKSHRKLKEAWIKQKYGPRFILGDVPRASLRLMEAARSCNTLDVAKAIIEGADIHWRNKNDGKTALHLCVACKKKDNLTSPLCDLYKLNALCTETISEHDVTDSVWKGIVCAEFLLQNGADIAALDINGETAIDCSQDQKMVDFLNAKARKDHFK